MAMGMDLSWHHRQAQYTERCSRCGVGMCATHVCLRCAAETHADERVANLQAEVQRAYAETDRMRMEAAGLRQTINLEVAKNDELRARLEARVRLAMCVTPNLGDSTTWACTDCGASSDDGWFNVRHVSGERIHEEQCPTLGDMRAIGFLALDDAEEVPSNE